MVGRLMKENWKEFKLSYLDLTEALSRNFAAGSKETLEASPQSKYPMFLQRFEHCIPRIGAQGFTAVTNPFFTTMIPIRFFIMCH
jgi:hypothetical protein